jgi:Flp pilus assembly protein CpaB
MAEEAPRVNNTKLLLISVLLGLVVMVVYNVHIRQVRSEARGESVTVYRLRRDARPREEIEMADLREVDIPQRVFESLGNPIKKIHIQDVIGTTRLYKPVSQGDYLTWDHFSSSGGASPTEEIEIGMRGTTIEFDPRKSPGELLRRGDHVDVLGILRPPGEKESTTYLILPAVKVIRVPGEEINARGGGGSRSRYRTVQVQVTPEVSKQLKNVMTWVEGSLWIDVRPSTETLPDNAGEIHDELDELPANVGGRRSGSFDGFE